MLARALVMGKGAEMTVYEYALFEENIRAKERANIIEEVDLHLREADYEYDSNMGIGDNVGSALLKEYANGYKKGEQDGRADERAKILMPYDVESIDDLIENVRAKVI